MTISAADRGSLMRARLGFGDRPATGRRWPPGGRTLVGARGLPSSNPTTGSRFYEHLRSADVGRTGRKWARDLIPRNSVARGLDWGARARPASSWDALVAIFRTRDERANGTRERRPSASLTKCQTA